jgi:putative oxidoreductase
MKTSIKNYMLWAARLIAALIMLQTLYFKFSGAAESVYIFTAVGMEPWGRYAVGILELIASVLLVITSVSWLGALLSTGLMSGAIFMHLTQLGIEVQGDGGYLFMLALIVLLLSVFVLSQNVSQIRNALQHFIPSGSNR